MKKTYTVTFFTCAVVIAVVLAAVLSFHKSESKTLKVGFIYVGDASTSYTNNFIEVQNAIADKYGKQVKTIAMCNVAEGTEEEYLERLIDSGCELIIATSYNYGATMKKLAEKYPDIEFCMATCSNANEEPRLENYHTFMGAIYQGRYTAGVAAGMKLQELIDNGTITKEQAKIGYVAAYPYAEVISGYTAFLLGVRSIVPDAVMSVRYTNNWNDYLTEKKYAKEFIDEGCVIISQHSDTTGPATACEATDSDTPVYIVSYNESMANVAPTTYLTGCKINWEPYVTGAVESVLKDKKIEENVKGNVVGNDMGAGFEEGWVEMLELNELVAAKGTKAKMQEVINGFKKGKIQVFQGDYIGVDPEDPKDTCNLKKGYIENENSSAPTFRYVLKDVITVEE